MAKSIEQEIEQLLSRKDYQVLADICGRDRRYWKVLRKYVYETDPRWYHLAAEGIACLMQRRWESGEKEPVREYIRGLFWSLNDESGGIGWNAPQIIAEIIVRVPALMKPYASMMADRTMAEPLLVPGGLWAVGRLGRPMQPVITFFEDTVMGALQTDEPVTLGVGAWAMGGVGFTPALPFLNAIGGRPEPVSIYVDGAFITKSIGQWVAGAIEKLRCI